MSVRADNAVKYKCHALSSAAHIRVTGRMHVPRSNETKYKCNLMSSVVHITIERYICIRLQ